MNILYVVLIIFTYHFKPNSATTQPRVGGLWVGAWVGGWLEFDYIQGVSKKGKNVCLFNISKTNKQISKLLFFWKLRFICTFWIQNQLCAIFMDWEIYKTKRSSSRQVHIHTELKLSTHHQSSLEMNRRALDRPNHNLRAPQGPKVPQLVSQGVSGSLSGQSGHLKATLRQWGPLQVSINMYLPISEPGFVLQISQPPKIAQNWFCIQNLHMDLSFQKKKTV